MLGMKSWLLIGAMVMFAGAAAVVAHDLFFVIEHGAVAEGVAVRRLRWRTGLALLLMAWTPVVIAIMVASA